MTTQNTLDDEELALKKEIANINLQYLTLIHQEAKKDPVKAQMQFDLSHEEDAEIIAGLSLETLTRMANQIPWAMMKFNFNTDVLRRIKRGDSTWGNLVAAKFAASLYRK